MDARTTAPERYVVISADMHGGATVQGYRPYLASRWPGGVDEGAAATPSRWVDSDDTEEARCRWDSDLRLARLEEQGICAELIFPTRSRPFIRRTRCSRTNRERPMTTNGAWPGCGPTTVGWSTSARR